MMINMKTAFSQFLYHKAWFTEEYLPVAECHRCALFPMYNKIPKAFCVFVSPVSVSYLELGTSSPSIIMVDGRRLSQFEILKCKDRCFPDEKLRVAWLVSSERNGTDRVCFSGAPNHKAKGCPKPKNQEEIQKVIDET